jgi:hypothetical protein
MEFDGDDHAADRQLTRARERWGRIGRVLASDGASPRVMGYFYKEIIQSVLLYGVESWTLTERTIRRFHSFHNRVARYITGRHVRQREDGTYDCPPTVEVLADAGLENIETYIQRRRGTIQDHVRTRPIYGKCRRSKALSTNVTKVVWWELP